MNLSMQNQALLRGILVGAVLSGATACSRHDRAGAGRDTTESGATAVTPSDSQTSTTAPQLSTGAATQPSGDTARTTVRDAGRTIAQAPTPRTGPSSTQATRDTTVKSAEAGVSGYREMKRDTSAQVSSASSVRAAAPDTTSPETAGTGAATPLDSAGVTSDYALTTDTATAGYSEMARDTSSAAGRGDTAAVAVADTTTPAGSANAGIKVQLDTTTAQTQVDTTAALHHTDTLAVATADSADTVGAKGEQAASQVANADTRQGNSGRIRPPEDSTEIAGHLTGDTSSAVNGNVANQAGTERIRPPEDSTEILGNVTSDKDRAEPTAREVPTEAARAASMGNAVTGIDVVSLMSRAGARCVVKDASSDVSWDLADSPAALNPCGTGTMTLSLVKTGQK
jgi:hypothetical protein